MSTKVKNLLKGLRYISQIFDEKEEEIQIGLPTDVKHVAHIGWDGPSANLPSWMNEFRSPTEITSGPLEPFGQLSSKGIEESIAKNDQKPRRHHSSNLGSPTSSPTHRTSESPKNSRRRHSKKDASASPARDSSGSSRHSRRQQKSNLGPPTDTPAIPKSSRRKKGSNAVEGGSTRSSRSSRSSRSKGQSSLTEMQFSEIEILAEPGNNEGKSFELGKAEYKA